MAYAVLADVLPEFKNTVFTDSDFITPANIAAFIDQASAFINAYLNAVYTLPVTGDADSLNMLKFLTVSLVAIRMRGILQVKQPSNTDANSEAGKSITYSQILKILADLKSGAIILTGADQPAQGGAFYSWNQAHNVQPVFQKDLTQW